MNKILRFLAAYSLWILIVAFGIYIFLMSREAFLDVLASQQTPGDPRLGYQARFYGPVFSIIVGLAWLAYMIVSEERLRKSIRAGGMLRVFSRFFGVELFLFFFVDFVILLVQGSAGVSSLRILILILELGAGTLLTYLGWSRRSPLPEKTRRVSSPPPLNT